MVRELATFRAGLCQLENKGFRISAKKGKSAEVWKGIDYVCLVGYAKKNKKWFATHNMDLEEGTHFTALDAVEAYIGKFKIKGTDNV